MSDWLFYDQLTALERGGTPFVLVVLVDTVGSVPQDAGAKMLVTAAGVHKGTIGGGKVEAAALKIAAEMLSGGGSQPRFVSWSLKGDVGMTCGGSVKLYFEPHPAPSSWPIAVFGAGHIAQALLPVLLPLPCFVTCYDTRSDWLARLPVAPNLRAVHSADLAAEIDALPGDTHVLLMTQGHATDRPILQRALGARRFPFVGVIGSEAKAAILRRELVAEGLPPERAKDFFCPVGLDFGTNHPHEIALSIAAQLITVRDRHPPITPRDSGAIRGVTPSETR